MKTMRMAAIAAILGGLALASCQLPDYNSAFSAHTVTEYGTVDVAALSGVDDDFIRGVDISMLGAIEDNGGEYYDNDGRTRDLFALLAERGVNWARLRIWNNPVDDQGMGLGGGDNDLTRTLALARRAKAAGLKLLVDFHYSDTWTHPGQQAKPAAWEDLDATDLGTAVHDWTYRVVDTLAEAGALPDMVQIGNEIDTGMLLPTGSTSSPAVLGALLNQGSSGARQAASDNGGSLQVMVHLARGGRVTMYQSFFDRFAPHDTDGNGTFDAAGAAAATSVEVDFDVIGLSYYPWWHSAAADSQATSLDANLANLAGRYGKDLVVAETAYAWTLDWADDTSNSFGSDTDVTNGGFAATLQGQADAIRSVAASVAAVEGGRGFFWWEPAWIPVDEAGWTAGEGTSWENCGVFDFHGQTLPTLDIFRKLGE